MELTRIWDVIRRRKWVIIQALVLITLVAVAGSYMITPAYEASSQIMIKQPKKSGIDMGRLFQSKNINIGLSGLSTIITTSPGVDINKILATSRPIINRMVWKLQLRDSLLYQLPSLPVLKFYFLRPVPACRRQRRR